MGSWESSRDRFDALFEIRKIIKINIIGSVMDTYKESL